MPARAIQLWVFVLYFSQALIRQMCYKPEEIQIKTIRRSIRSISQHFAAFRKT